ncbi:MAG TPA: hypothetical protein VFV87_12435 [Pirellulaceae bacterium]|nr:hypothetical protein [Pirellulaceae bacterium]
MALNSGQVRRLLKMIRQTREAEMTCPECLDELDKYTQKTIDGTPIDGVLVNVREHLEACPFCMDQFNLVLEALQAIDELYAAPVTSTSCSSRSLFVLEVGPTSADYGRRKLSAVSFVKRHRCSWQDPRRASGRCNRYELAMGETAGGVLLLRTLTGASTLGSCRLVGPRERA